MALAAYEDLSAAVRPEVTPPDADRLPARPSAGRTGHYYRDEWIGEGLGAQGF